MTLRFGLFLNTSVVGQARDADVLDLMATQAVEGEAAGYDEAWVSEHHFEGYGINPSALVAGSFLLGRTSRLKVGSAVVLTPHYHPLQLAEQTILLDHLSGGRFTLGVGRGGFLKEFSAFGTPQDRWDEEPAGTMRIVSQAWMDAVGESGAVHVTPSARAGSSPPLAVASSAPGSVALAAAMEAPLLHYWSTPPAHRRQAEDAYTTAARSAGRAPSTVDHVHQVMVAVTPEGDSPALRARLAEAALDVLRRGDSTPVAAVARKLGDMQMPSLEARAQAAAASGMVGTPEQVASSLHAFLAATGARRVVAFHELLGTPTAVLDSLQRFAADVIPLLAGAQNPR